MPNARGTLEFSTSHARPRISRSDAAAPKPAEVLVGDARIGPGLPTYVIAEVGVNHDGSVAKALRLVDVAKDCGANAVKFQLFRAEELATPDAAAAQYQRNAGEVSQREMLARLELSDEAFTELKAYCERVQIEFIATPFGMRDVERLLAMRVRGFKTASTDLNNIPLMRRIAATGLPMIVSTGASLADEIVHSVVFLRSVGAAERLILLHCISAYPTPIEQANLRAIATLRDSFHVPAGFSDHTTSTEMGAWAVAAGACVLEKHITLDRRAPGPDHALSLEPSAFREYVNSARRVEKTLGSGELGMCSIEQEVRRVARKSIVAAVELDAGVVLTERHLAVKRPSGGIEPVEFDRVVGKRLTRAVSAETVLQWDMLA